MASKIEAIMAINANAEVTVTDNVIDCDSDIDAKVTELQAAEDAKETAKTNAKVSGNTKLLGLGLSQEEATALTGYTPE